MARYRASRSLHRKRNAHRAVAKQSRPTCLETVLSRERLLAVEHLVRVFVHAGTQRRAADAIGRHSATARDLLMAVEMRNHGAR